MELQWGGRVWRLRGVVPSEIDHLLSPLRSFSPVAVSKQLHYEADQIKTKQNPPKKRKKWHTTIWQNSISVFKQGQESVTCGSYSVDTPHRGDLSR